MSYISAIKRVVRIGIWIWFGYLLSRIFIGDLGASPALELNHQLGDFALALLTLNLVYGALIDCVKPAPSWLRAFMIERRYWGVSAFIILVFHVFFYFVNEGFEAKAWTQIVTKTYLIFGAIALLIISILAATSNALSVRRFGYKNWKRLHRLVYGAQVVLFGHLMLIEKADLVFYGTWLGGLLLLQLVRFAYVYRFKLNARR